MAWSHERIVSIHVFLSQSDKWHCNDTRNQCSWRRILIMCDHVCLHKHQQRRLMMYEGLKGLPHCMRGISSTTPTLFWVLAVGGQIWNGIEPSNLFCSNLWLTFLLFVLLKNTRRKGRVWASLQTSVICFCFTTLFDSDKQPVIRSVSFYLYDSTCCPHTISKCKRWGNEPCLKLIFFHGARQPSSQTLLSS